MVGAVGAVFLTLLSTRATATVVIHEVAWMGTSRDSSEQWVELYNAGSRDAFLQDWLLINHDGSVSNRLHGRLVPGQTLLLAATTEDHLAGVPVHHILSGPLKPAGDQLTLLNGQGQVQDFIDQWHAGCSDQFATMQRVYPYTAGNHPLSWKTSTIRYDIGYGTPGFRRPPDYTEQELFRVYHDEGTINVYFNQSALIEWALPGNQANHRINLEERIIERIRQARHTIDLATYEINLPDTVEALMDRAAEGVQVRLLVDAKSPSDGERNARYRLMRLLLERMARGHDGRLGSPDSIQLFANSPIFAVMDPEERLSHGLPRVPRDLEEVTLDVGRGQSSGRLLVHGAEVSPGVFYGPGGQMHNKFLLIDDYRLLTGSMNLTITGVYGSERNRLARVPNGNSNHLLDIHSPTAVELYRDEFNIMWGCSGVQPCSQAALFRGAKPQGQIPHQIQIGDYDVQIMFSPGYDVVPRITDFVATEANTSLYFCIFAWSDSALENVIKQKWEGSPDDLEGEWTGFVLKGVFERLFWNQWWSANQNMTGRTADRASYNNPNIRWRNTPPVFRDRESRKLHHKYMIVDAGTAYNPTVITGSANWSRNANSVNDENTLFIHDGRIVNQFVQEFYARYEQAGGEVHTGEYRVRQTAPTGAPQSRHQNL